MLVALIFTALLVSSSRAESQLQFEAPASLPISSGELVLHGSDARRQILVTEFIGSSESHDATHRVVYRTEPAGIIRATNGMIVPLKKTGKHFFACVWIPGSKRGCPFA